MLICKAFFTCHFTSLSIQYHPFKFSDPTLPYPTAYYNVLSEHYALRYLSGSGIVQLTDVERILLPFQYPEHSGQVSISIWDNCTSSVHVRYLKRSKM